jgi:hypothetical protein
MRSILLVSGAAVAAIAIAGPVDARPATSSFFGPICDSVTPTIDHELGTPPPLGGFPTDEAIATSSVEVNHPVCPVPFFDPAAPDFEVSITNLTGRRWVDLWFVADITIPFGNPDGLMGDTTPDAAPGDSIGQAFAFRIDNLGINLPLVFESIAPDLIFDPGETWVFIVQDWGGPAPPHLMGSVGFAGRSPTLGGDGSVASIVARELRDIPAPASLSLMAFGLAALGLRRRRRSA